MRNYLLRIFFILASLISWLVPARGSAQTLSGPAGALVFDGAKTFVQVSSNASLTLNTRATFEAWVNPSAQASGTILSRGDGGNGATTDYIVQLATISGALKLAFFTTNGWDYSTGTVPSNAWTHVAVTYDGTNKQFFINGVLDSTVSRPGGFYSSGSPVYLGRQGSACNCNYFKGTMDEVRIWNTNRTASQISQNFNHTLAGTEAGLAAYYKFDYLTGIITRDSSTNGNTGILMNRPLPVPSLAPFPLYLVLNNPNPFTNDCGVPFVDPGATVTAAPFSIGGFIGSIGSAAAIKPDGNLEVWDSSGSSDIVTNLIAVAISRNILGLRANGTVVPWGDNSYGEMNVPANATNVVAVSDGQGFDFALRADGTVVGWGDNTYGETNIPASATNVVAIAAGANNALALRADGTVIGWGRNESGLLNIPPSATNVVAIANDLSAFVGIALKADGSVLAWGSDEYGETNVPASATNVVAIAVDSLSLLALKADGTVVAWGYGYGGQTNIPANATNVVAIAVSSFGSLFLKADGTLLTTSSSSSPIPANIDALSVPVSATGTVNPGVFGNYPITYNATNASGAVGATNRIVVVADTKPPDVTLLGANPMIVNFDQPFVDPGATAFDQCAGDETGSIVAAGTVNTNVPGLYQRTYTVSDPNGNSRTKVRSVIVQPPQQLVVEGSNSIALECHSGPYVDAGAAVFGTPLGIAAEGSDSFAIRPSRTISGWGTNGQGEINIPASATNVVAISGGASHALALRADGSVVAWGYNGNGEANVPASATNVIAFAAGAGFSLAARADGTVVGWGDDFYGEIDIPASTTDVIALAAGNTHSVALRADGTVVAWGDDSVGQTDVPASANHIIAISAEEAGFHTLALKADGTLIAWGDNGSGQTNVPASATNVVAIAAGGAHNLALRADGTIIAWGDNGSGQTNVPASATNVVAIAAGGAHNLALRADGTIIAWGYNGSGQTNVPAINNLLPLPVTTNNTVNPNAVGTYFVTYTATNFPGNSLTNTRTVTVSDSLPPTVTLLGANPYQLIAGSSFADPGATASDQCAGDLTGSIVVGGSVNNFVLGIYTLTYNVTDPSGNPAGTNRTVQVVAAPSLSAFAASLTATNPATASVTAQLSANVNPNGLPTSAYFHYGLNTGYSGSAAPTNFPGVYASSNMTVLTANLSRGIVYHWRAVGSNSVGVTYGPDQVFMVPGLYAAGDLNGDGIVSAGELNGVLSNYFATSPWLYLTNTAGLGQSNVTFALTNSLEGAFTVQVSSNLIDWQDLGPAIPRYQFTDTNAPSAPNRYYRLRWP